MARKLFRQRSLAAVAARLESHEAATVAAQAAATIVQAITDAKDPLEWGPLQGLAAVAACLEPEDAAVFIFRAVKVIGQSPADAPKRADALSILLSGVPAAQARLRCTTASAAVALESGTGHPFAALTFAAVQPPTCRLSTQQLVELLKMPTCFGDVRRVVLDQLGNRYHRTFRDAWEFVRFAKEQNLDLNFTSPPQRPEAAPVAATGP